MARKTSPLMPATERLLEDLGDRLRLARLRRRLPAKQLAERAGMAQKTLRAVEHGAPGVTLGAYAAVLQVLQLEQGLAQIAAVDALGRALQDKALEGGPTPYRVSRAPRVATGPSQSSPALGESARSAAQPGGVSSDELLALLNLPKPARPAAKARARRRHPK
jgi:transcriptional regulator with XRE-family HTH domain